MAPLVAGHDDQPGVELSRRCDRPRRRPPRDRVQALGALESARGRLRHVRAKAAPRWPARCGSSSRPLRADTRRSPSRPRACRRRRRRESRWPRRSTSARVGRRECCMLSSICVAMITGFCRGIAHGHDPLLHDRHLGHVDLDAQVAAGHHHAVGRGDDLGQAGRAPPAFRSWRSRGPTSRASAAAP